MLVIDNTTKLNDFLKVAGLTRPKEIAALLSDKKILVSPLIAKLILKVA